MDEGHPLRTHVRTGGHRRQAGGLVVFGLLLALGVGGGLVWASLTRGGGARVADDSRDAGTGAAVAPIAREPLSPEAPQVGFDEPGVDRLVSSEVTVSVVATGDALARLWVTLDATQAVPLSEASESPTADRMTLTFRFDPTGAGIVDGGHHLIASAITSAGGVASVRLGITIDLTPPSVDVVAVTPASGLYPGRHPRALKIAVQGKDGQAGKLRYAGEVRTGTGTVLGRLSEAAPADERAVFEWDGRDARGRTMAGGTYKFAVRAKDEAGHTSAWADASLRLLTLKDIARRFSGARAKGHARALAAIGVRRAGTPNEARAADYVARTFEDFGYTPRRTHFKLVNGARSQNVVAVVRGSSSRAPIIIVGAHMDSIDNLGKRSVGGNDDAGGVGVMLETARVLASIPAKHELRFVAFGAEERIDTVPDHHHEGSRVMARSLTSTEMRRGVRMVNLDMVGVGYRMGIGTQSGATESFARYHLQTAGLIGYKARFAGHGSGSDHEAFVKRSIPVAYYDWGPDPHYHTSRDTADRLQVSALEATGRTLAASLFRMAAR